MLKYIIYAIKIEGDVTYDIHAADDVMATGYNWCPPLALIDAFGGKEKFEFIVESVFDRELLLKIEFKKCVKISFLQNMIIGNTLGQKNKYKVNADEQDRKKQNI